jgi:hypothetical protein
LALPWLVTRSTMRAAASLGCPRAARRSGACLAVLKISRAAAGFSAARHDLPLITLTTVVARILQWYPV